MQKTYSNASMPLDSRLFLSLAKNDEGPTIFICGVYSRVGINVNLRCHAYQRKRAARSKTFDSFALDDDDRGE